MARKNIQDLIGELQSWLPNYNHGPNDYPILLFRILASLPGGDELEDIGYETFNLGWHEADQLARVIDAIQDKQDVEDIVRALLHDEEEEEEDLEEARRRRAPSSRHRAPPARGNDYGYAPSPSGKYALTRDGEEIMRGTEQEIWTWMHRHVSSSIHHALKYEGYKITPVGVSAREAPRRRTPGSRGGGTRKTTAKKTRKRGRR